MVAPVVAAPAPKKRGAPAKAAPAKRAKVAKKVKPAPPAAIIKVLFID